MRIMWIPIILWGVFATAQSQDQQGLSRNESMTGMGEGTASAMHSMESRHMDMGPHMKMTDLRPIQPGDKEKAD